MDNRRAESTSNFVKATGPRSHCGTVVAVRGSVIDVHFERGLPAINTVLRTGHGHEVIIEVLAQLDEHRVRCVALTSTQGLARGTGVEDSGGPLKAPVAFVQRRESAGKAIVGDWVRRVRKAFQ